MKMVKKNQILNHLERNMSFHLIFLANQCNCPELPRK
jgi:hypothetical protein